MCAEDKNTPSGFKPLFQGPQHQHSFHEGSNYSYQGQVVSSHACLPREDVCLALWGWGGERGSPLAYQQEKIEKARSVEIIKRLNLFPSVSAPDCLSSFTTLIIRLHRSPGTWVFLFVFLFVCLFLNLVLPFVCFVFVSQRRSWGTWSIKCWMTFTQALEVQNSLV